MCNLLRRLFWLALLGGATYAVYTVLQERRREPAGDAPTWPPFPDGPAATTSATEPAAPGETDAEQRWVPPVEGACPEGYPIKGNDGSGIYHVPGGRFYDRTIPERCYANETDAEADGYRRSKA